MTKRMMMLLALLLIASPMMFGQTPGNPTANGHWVVSADGAELTLTTTGTLETGQRVKETMVFRKH